MDIQRALKKVDDLLRLLDSSHHFWNEGQTKQAQLLDDEIRQLIPGMENIAMAAGWNHQVVIESTRGWPWSGAQRALLRLKGDLSSREEIEEIIGPKGPALSAQGLHRWVWEAAASLWDDGYRREAINAAATQVDEHLKAKLGRQDKSGTDLIREAFRTTPPEIGKPRLRFDGIQPGTQDFTNAHEGAMHFGAGCFMAIRNIATHKLAQPEEAIALEQLAALSVLARWIDVARVVTA